MRGHVGRVMLARPEQMNTWTPGMEAGLRRQLLQWAGDNAIRVVLLTGQGSRAFCAGVDMASLQAFAAAGRQPQAAERVQGDMAQRYSYLLGIPQPIVCALNGAAVGVGLVLALYSDLRIASHNARLGAVFARRGLVAEHGIAWLLPRLIGHAAAADLLLRARMLTAEEALRIGLLSAVFDENGFEDSALAFASDLASGCSPRATRIIKRQLVEGLTQSLTQAVHLAEDETVECIASEDFREGVRHFVEKRAPRFTGS